MASTVRSFVVSKRSQAPLRAPCGRGLLGAFGDGVAVPGAGGGERPVEAGDRVERVRLGVLAEAAAGDRGPYRPVVEDLHLGRKRPVQRLARVEQDVGLVGGGEGVALHTGAAARGELGVDPGLQPDLVVAGARLLVVVAELRRVLGVVGLCDVAGSGQGRQITAEPAADTGEMDGGEAADVVLAVVVTGVVAGVRGELHHAERHGGARVGVALVLGADERVDQVGQSSVGTGRGLGRGPGGEDTAEERDGGERGRRTAKSRPWGPVHGVLLLGQRCQSAIILGSPVRRVKGSDTNAAARPVRTGRAAALSRVRRWDTPPRPGSTHRGRARPAPPGSVRRRASRSGGRR